MIVGCLIYLFAVLLNKVSLEYTVTGYVGKAAVLNCSYTADKNKVHDVNWMYNHTNIVYSFSPYRSQSNPVDQKFESFPLDYTNGTYSIKIKKLKKTDEGVYTCIITPADYYTNIKLIIKESHPDTTGPDTCEENKETPALVTTVCVVVAVIVIVVILLIVCIRKGYVGCKRKMYASCCLGSATKTNQG